MLVYLLTNSVNGKQYVGITGESLRRRWSRHCSDALRGSKVSLHRAIRTHGVDAFLTETIATADSWDDLQRLEITEIANRRTHISLGGYNMTTGGDGTRGYTRSAETLQRMSASRKGIRQPPEALIKRSVSRTGMVLSQDSRANIAAGLRGRPVSDETRAKIAASVKAHWEKNHEQRTADLVNSGAVAAMMQSRWKKETPNQEHLDFPEAA